jgi:hypothetical protein
MFDVETGFRHTLGKLHLKPAKPPDYRNFTYSDKYEKSVHGTWSPTLELKMFFFESRSLHHH